MNLREIAKEINELLAKRREELGLYFIEEDHKYFMKDLKGELRSDFPSVSTVLKKFYTPFDAVKKSLEMRDGDEVKASLLREEWEAKGSYATNMGSRVHFILEQEVVDRNGSYKEVRRPIFEVDEEQTQKGDNMVYAGKNFLDLMERRGAVLLDTEIVLGDNEMGYTGQPDKVWLMHNKDKSDFGIVITDWKGLPTTTPMLTTNGWKTMGSLTKEDKVFDKNGEETDILHLSKVKEIECHQMTLDTGEIIISDKEHRWLVYDKDGVELVLTTEQIREGLKYNTIYKIPVAKPLNLPKVDLLIPPYDLGLTLKDKIGLIGDENIDKYLLSSYGQRLSMLRGLMEGFGYTTEEWLTFDLNTSESFDFICSLLGSLGIKFYVGKFNYKNVIRFKVPINDSVSDDYKYIRSVSPITSVPTRCIEVSSESHTYLYGKHLTVTHNTNQPKNFEIQPYTVPMLPPFEQYPDTALSHYFCQLPLYGKLLLKMLKGTKYENTKLMGGVVVLVKEDGEFIEYRIPNYFFETILSLDMQKILKK